MKTLKEQVQALEIEIVTEALQRNGYLPQVACREIGMSPQGILNKIRRYKIPLIKNLNEHRCSACGRLFRVSSGRRKKKIVKQ